MNLNSTSTSAESLAEKIGCFDPSIPENEVSHRDRVKAWWLRAGRQERWSATDEDVLALLRAAEYRCDLETLLVYLCNGYIFSPPMVNDRRQWSATHLVMLASALEGRRRWIGFSEIHDEKKTTLERTRDECEAAGVPMFHDLAKTSAEDVMLIMQFSDDPHVREACRFALMDKLGMR